MTSLSWIKSIEDDLGDLLKEANALTLLPFSLEQFTSDLSEKIGIQPLSIELEKQEWLTDKNFFSGFGDFPITTFFELTPLEGTCCWVMAQEDISELVSWVKDQNKQSLELDNPDLIQGIYHYLLLTAMNALKTSFKPSSLKLKKEATLSDKGYTIDLSLTHGEKILYGRIILSLQLHQSFHAHLSKKKTSLSDITKRFPSLKVPLSIVNGSVKLTQEELSSLHEGDFIVVDKAYFRPNNEKGTLTVLLSQSPLFQAKWKEGELKVLDFIYPYKECDNG